jgi:hypothetical protein
MLNDVTIVGEEVLFQKFFHVNPAASDLSGVNVPHYDRISSPISVVHQQTAEVLQMQAQVLGKISNFVNVQGSVGSLIAYAEFQFEGFHVDFRDVRSTNKLASFHRA